MRLLYFVTLAFAFLSCGRNEGDMLSVVQSQKSFQEWCSDTSATKEQRKTVEKLLSAAGTSDCFEANYRFLGTNELNLWGAGVKDLEPIGSLSHLETLELGSTPVESLASLPTLPKLRSLGLASSKIKTIEDIGRFAQVRTLNLSNTPLLSLQGIERLTYLRKLVLNRTGVISLEPLRMHTILEHFEMDACVKAVAPLNLDALVTNKIAYRVLSITSCGLTSARDLRDVRQIAELNLSGNQIADLDFLENTLELHRFSANGNRISSIGVLKKFSRTLSEVHLRNNRIEDVTALVSLKYIMSQGSLLLQGNPVRKERCPTESENAPLRQFCMALQDKP